VSETPKRAIIYTRVSKDDTGVGLANQRQELECRRLAEYRHWTVVEVEQDIAISASTGKLRPAWERVLEAIRNNEVDYVVAYHLDRMTRSMTELEELIVLAESTQVGIATVVGDIDLTNDMGRMIARILAAVARQEGERKSARQKSANRQRATEGKSWASGWRSFGYALDGTVIDEEAIAYRLAFDDVLAGKASLRAVSRRWTEQGFKGRNYSKTATGWTHHGVRFTLLNPRYAGISTYRGEVVGDGNWPALISKGEHIEMKALLTDKSRMTNDGRGGRTPRTLLSGIAACEKCDETVNGGPRLGVPVYRCRKDCVGTPRLAADEYVLDVIGSAVHQLGPALVLGHDASELEVDDDAHSVEALVERREALNSAMTKGRISPAEWDTGIDEVNALIKNLERRSIASAPTVKSLTQGAQAAMEEIRTMSLADQRRVVQAVADVTLRPRGRGRRNVPIEDQVDVWIKVGGDDAISAETLRTMEQEEQQ
jgi:site-specific DNA recombinase